MLKYGLDSSGLRMVLLLENDSVLIKLHNGWGGSGEEKVHAHWVETLSYLQDRYQLTIYYESGDNLVVIL